MHLRVFTQMHEREHGGEQIFFLAAIKYTPWSLWVLTVFQKQSAFLSYNTQAYKHHIVQISTPIILTQHQPHCFPRVANGTSPLTEVSCANRQKGFQPGESKQGYDMVQEQQLTMGFYREKYCTQRANIFLNQPCLEIYKICNIIDIIASTPFPESRSCPPCPSPRPPQWHFLRHSAPLDPTPAPVSLPSEGNGFSW